MTRGRIHLSLLARIVIITLIGQLGLIALGGYALALRDGASSRAQQAALAQNMEAIFRANLSAAWRDLEQVATSPALTQALKEASPSALAAVLDGLMTQFGAVRVEQIDAQGQLLDHTGSELIWRPTLGPEGVTEALQQGSLSALRLDWARQLVILHAQRVSPEQVLTLAVPLDPVLGEFARLIDGAALVVNRRGRVLVSTDADLAASLPLQHGLLPSYQEMDVAERRLALVVVPLGSAPGELVAQLIAVQDISALSEQLHSIQRWTLVLLALAVGVLLLAVALYLRREFAPLASAVKVLDALAEGDTSVAVGAHAQRVLARRDEVGHLMQALEHFRTQMMTLRRMERAQERQRRRQEGFIRQEMTTLAGTLAPLAREEVLKDLHAIEAAAVSESGALGLIGPAFRTMSLRVQQQQQHLEQLIQELREALKVKTAFIQLRQELDIARDIQQSMLPHKFPTDRPELNLYAQMNAAKEVGGDFYDYFFLDAHRIGIVIADVSGKGVPAALFMAISRTLLRATALFGSLPASCLENLNDLLAENNEKCLFVTVFYGILDLRDGRFVYSNAGHNPPYQMCEDGSVVALPRTGGMVLAAMEGIPQKNHEVRLVPGEQVFLFTDGISEAQNAAEELFGEPRIEDCLRELRGSAPEQVIASLLQSLETFVGDAPQFDDITCLALRWNHPIS